MDTADVAKEIRKDLKASWPDVKFRVHTRKYAGGSSVDVQWTDGPTTTEVDAKIGRWEGKGFDGMTDCSYYKEPLMHNGELVRTYCYVQTSRSHSPLAYAQAVNAICKYYGMDPGEVRLDPASGFPTEAWKLHPCQNGPDLQQLLHWYLGKTGPWAPETEPERVPRVPVPEPEPYPALRAI
jgi:hypothetical protein